MDLLNTPPRLKIYFCVVHAPIRAVGLQVCRGTMLPDRFCELAQDKGLESVTKYHF